MSFFSSLRLLRVVVLYALKTKKKRTKMKKKDYSDPSEIMILFSVKNKSCIQLTVRGLLQGYKAHLHGYLQLCKDCRHNLNIYCSLKNVNISWHLNPYKLFLQNIFSFLKAKKRILIKVYGNVYQESFL